jgi:hypothetical protein
VTGSEAAARRRVVLAPPQPHQRGATFHWQVEPATTLYARTHFSLSLPAGLDGRDLPASLWWTIMLLCLHSHWNLLRPCTVELPVTLLPGHRAFWLRLLESEMATLAAYSQGGCVGDGWGDLELVDGGPALTPAERLTEAGRCAAAFSGGKDSLLQAALLAELGYHPILVPTTSPMPPLNDHQTSRRRHVLDAIGQRREVDLVEVKSDLRSSWRNDFPPLVGYPVSVNEITDTFLYTAALLAVADLRGATHLSPRLGGRGAGEHRDRGPHGAAHPLHVLGGNPGGARRSLRAARHALRLAHLVALQRPGAAAAVDPLQ